MKRQVAHQMRSDTDQQESRRPLWARTSTFTPVLSRPPDYQDDPTLRADWSPIPNILIARFLKTWQHSQIKGSCRLQEFL
ncbi:hypothetical protein AOLI_G00282710 [Acnodon oligacanthus]